MSNPCEGIKRGVSTEVPAFPLSLTLHRRGGLSSSAIFLWAHVVSAFVLKGFLQGERYRFPLKDFSKLQFYFDIIHITCNSTVSGNGKRYGKIPRIRDGRARYLKILNILSDPNFINYMPIAWGWGTKCKLWSSLFLLLCFPLRREGVSCSLSLSASSTETLLYLSRHSILGPCFIPLGHPPEFSLAL